MLEEGTLRPVIIAMALYLIISYISTDVLKKPTNVKPIDETIAMMITQKGFLVYATVLTGLIVYLSNYISDEYV
jgi:hypothetical protein|tara:strand:+ start:667 stop:888 length:222 start_codon:yes stop_codon:yes gene_type:complete